MSHPLYDYIVETLSKGTMEAGIHHLALVILETDDEYEVGGRSKSVLVDGNTLQYKMGYFLVDVLNKGDEGGFDVLRARYEDLLFEHASHLMLGRDAP